MRRAFIALLGGAAAFRFWPLAARAQERVRRIGVLMHSTADEPEAQARFAAFLQGLQEAGWDGRPQRADRHALERSGDADAPAQVRGGTGRARAGRHPGRHRRRPWRRCSRRRRTVPIVFAQSIDPVGAGFVESLARPGGNVTGFLQFEYGLSGKWLELLKEIAPQVTRVRRAAGSGDTSAGIGQWAVIQAVAPPLGVELSPIDVRDRGRDRARRRRRSRASRTAA